MSRDAGASGDDRAARAPWSAEAFEAALRGHHERYWHKHPFEERLRKGELTREQLRGWVANRHCFQSCLPRKDAAIVSNCADPEIRRRWVQRIVYQDGAAAGEGGLHEWRRLAEAIGVTGDELQREALVVPGARLAAESYVAFAQRSPWIEGVAASLTELFAPSLMKDRVAAFAKHYPWIDAGGHTYLHARAERAPRDAQYALELVQRFCVTRDQQERALAALAFKRDVLWTLLDAIHHAFGAG